MYRDVGNGQPFSRKSGKVAHALGYEVVSLDLSDATICCDIMDWDYKTFSVGYFDIIWASPPRAILLVRSRCFGSA